MKRFLKILAAGILLALPWIGAASAQQANNYWCNSATLPCPPSGWVPASAGNPIPITGSFSATTTGFPTTQTTGTPISVTTSSGAGTLPAGTVVVASNIGATNGAYCKLGATATTSDQLIPPNSWFAFTVGSATQLACITSTSTTTVNMVGGSGLPTGSGGGGGGSGGGLSVVDQTTWTQGTSPFTPTGCVFNAAATLTSGQEGTLRCNGNRAGIFDVDTSNNNLYTAITSPIVAGTNIIGKVGIDQTTPGTTNGVQVNAALPAGTNLLGKMGIDQTTPGTTNGVQVNSSSLPTGAATSANQIVGNNYGNQANWKYGTSTPTATASTPTVIAAPGSNKLYVSSMQCFNSGSTSSLVTLNDGATTVLYNPTISGIVSRFDPPLIVATTTALTAAFGSASTNQWCNAQAYNAP